MRTQNQTAALSDGLKDFWSVYDGCYAEMQAVLIGPLEDHPTFGPLIARQPQEQRDAQSAQSRGLLTKAIETNQWADYDHQLREQGSLYAALGIGFRDWYDIVRLVARYMVPKLTAAFLAEPDRLVAALQAQGEFYDHAMTVIGEAYIERSEARLRVSIAATEDVAAQETRTLLDNILQSSIKYSIIGKDLDRKILSWNEGARRNYGFTAEEMLGKSSDLLHTPEDLRSGAVQKLLDSAREKGLAEGEFERVRKDGSRFTASVVVTRRDDASGNPVGYLLMSSDISDKVRAEEQLRSASEYARTLVASSPNAMVVVDEDGRIALVNARTVEWFGYEQDELLGQPVELLVPERFRHQHPAHRQGYLADPVTRPMGTGRDLLARRKDGSEFPVDISLSTVRAQEGTQVIAAITDMTERKKSQDMLQRAKDAADAASRELEAFSYSVAHDLRAPLRSIDGFSQALLEDYADQIDTDGKRYLNHLREAAQEMGELIDDLLNLSRVTRAELRRERVDVSELARSVLTKLQEAQPDRDVEIVVEAGLVANADPRLLDVVLTNLLGNAWKFTGKRASARIEFGARAGEHPTVYFVRDNGAGFDPAYSGKLFGVFQRLHPARDFEGTGIGLATVQRIVHRHGGRIWAEGEVDRGATFYFTLEEEEHP